MNEKRAKRKVLLLTILKYIGIAAAAVTIMILTDSTKYRIVGVLLLFLTLPIYRLITQRRHLFDLMRTLETAIWGKPLDKLYWKKNELTNTKVKVVWGKKKNGHNTGPKNTGRRMRSVQKKSTRRNAEAKKIRSVKTAESYKAV